MIGLVLSCEHASWRLPFDATLGLDPDVIRTQAGWDHGAFEIAEQLGEAVGLPVHAGAFTRMFVDLNRPPEHPDVIPMTSYGVAVPGNVELDPTERATRIAQFHRPYWDAVRHDVAARLRDRDACLLLSSHSFDPALDPAARQFEVGVMYDADHAFEAELAERLMFRLRAAGLVVRANLPYPGTGPAICTTLRHEHAGRRYAGIMLESSHAVTQTPQGCARIAAAVRPFLDDL